MKEINVDIAVIGGGPAGLAAALEAKKQGAGKVLILERDLALGGILQQCIHDGFGLHRFGSRLSGSEYAQRFVDMLAGMDIEIMLDTMVLELTHDRRIYACNQDVGMIRIACGAVILAMGCRERSASQVMLLGGRPAGVMTAGAAQRYINMEGYLPGKNAVIMGSGDIGLIMARRMTLEGINVSGVYELMATPGGLTRNIVQCLDDYGIPLHLATTVTRIHGNRRIEGVTVMKVGTDRKPIAGTEEYVPCDLLVLAVGLIPENELSNGAGVEMDPVTRGPVVDNHFMTSVPGIFACGNVAVVFDLVDYVSDSGEVAARGAVKFLRGELDGEAKYVPTQAGENVNFVVPQRVRASDDGVTLYLRVKNTAYDVNMVCSQEGEKVYAKRHRFVAPPEMISCKIDGPVRLPLTAAVEGGKNHG